MIHVLTASVVSYFSAIRIENQVLYIHIHIHHHKYPTSQPPPQKHSKQQIVKQRMQELLLFGQVPLARHDYVLSVLAGIAAMQPKPILEKHLLFKPSRPLASVRASSAIAAVRQQGVSTSSQLQAPPGDLFYLKVVIDINDPTRSDAVAGAGAGTRAGAGAGVGAGAGTANFAVEKNNGWASNNKDGVSCSPVFLFYNPVFAK